MTVEIRIARTAGKNGSSPVSGELVDHLMTAKQRRHRGFQAVLRRVRADRRGPRRPQHVPATILTRDQQWVDEHDHRWVDEH
jgi:hypothetical protein